MYVGTLLDFIFRSELNLREYNQFRGFNLVVKAFTLGGIPSPRVLFSANFSPIFAALTIGQIKISDFKSGWLLAKFVAKELATIDSVTSTTTHFVMRRYKEMDVALVDTEQDDRGQFWI